MPRVAVVVDFACPPDADYAALCERYGMEGLETDVYVHRRCSRPGTPAGRMVSGRHESALVDRRFLGRGYEAVLFVYDDYVNASHLSQTLEDLRASGQRRFHVIPGVHELLTVGRATVSAYDLRDASARFWTTGARLGIVRERMRRWRSFASRHLRGRPRRVARRMEAAALGLAGRLSPSVRANLAAAREPERMLTDRAAPHVAERLIPSAARAEFSLGDRETQEHYFVDEVAKNFPFPRNISIVLSNTCNLKCTMCPFHSPQFLKHRTSGYFEDRRYVPLVLIQKLADEIAPHECSIHMGELDEPAMHRDLPEIVRLLARGAGKHVHITTNGNLWKPDLTRRLLENGLGSVSFSVDAMQEETYREIRGGDLKVVIRNIEELLRAKRELRSPVRVNVCIINQQGARDEITAFEEFWRTRGATSISVYQLFDLVDEEEFTFEVRNKNYREQKRTPCSALWDQCFVYPDGEISTCCTTLSRVPKHGVMSCGEILARSLQDVWLGETYQSIRRNLIREQFAEIPFCKGCSHWAATYQYRKLRDDDTCIVYNENEAVFAFADAA